MSEAVWLRDVVVLGPDDGFRAAHVPPGVEVVLAERQKFRDGEQLQMVADPAVLANRRVLVVQTTAPPQDARLLALLQLADAVRRASPASLTCFAPYLCYQRQDRATRPGQAVSGRLVLDLLAAAGVATVIATDLHSDRVLRDRDRPRVVNLTPAAAYAAHLRRAGIGLDLVVAADQGAAARASAVAARLDLPVLVLAKHKDSAGTSYQDLPPEVDGAACLVVEDLASSGSTLRPLCDVLALRAKRIVLCVSHVLLPVDRLAQRLPEIEHFVYTDSCGDPAAPVPLLPLALRVWAKPQSSA